jgi:hypothetical protein
MVKNCSPRKEMSETYKKEHPLDNSDLFVLTSDDNNNNSGIFPKRRQANDSLEHTCE